MIDDLPKLLAAIKTGRRPLVLFSGGLDGAYLLAAMGCKECVALTVDLGGDPLDRAAVELCQRIGVQHVVVDATARFVAEYVNPAITAQARYGGGHPICASLSRPLLAKIAVERARDLGCTLIVHTSNRSQNSLRRFNGAFRELGFQGEYGSPFASSYVSREEKRTALSRLGVSMYAHRVVSTDTNAWGREFEGSVLDDPEIVVVPSELYRWTCGPAESGAAERMTLRFSRGLPTHMNDSAMTGAPLLRAMNELVGQHGIGRYVGLEETQCGAKVQEVREMPAATLLLDAFRRLESASVPYECIREKMTIEQLWTREAVEGRWYGELRLACQAFIENVANRVSGEITYELGRGCFEMTGMRAENPLYVRDRQVLEGLTCPPNSALVPDPVSRSG